MPNGKIIDEDGVERQLLGKLPMTADGVVAGEGETVWEPYKNSVTSGIRALQASTYVNDDVPLSTCYASPENAVAALRQMTGGA